MPVNILGRQDTMKQIMSLKAAMTQNEEPAPNIFFLNIKKKA